MSKDSKKSKKANTYIKPSQIHGLGVFAMQAIMKGESIIQGKADYKNYIGEWIRYNKRGQISRGFDKGFCMINHSDNPNSCRANNFSIIANRNIFKDEEITECYNQLPAYENPFVMKQYEEFFDFIKNIKQLHSLA